jgi:phosphoribosylformylglycinamidine synthase subunit PurS
MGVGFECTASLRIVSHRNRLTILYFTFCEAFSVAQQYQAQIYVTLRPSVLDPAGVAVQSGLKHMGYDNVEGVRIGKYVELNLSADSEAAAQEQLNQVCDQLLANPVIENYRFELKAAG